MVLHHTLTILENYVNSQYSIHGTNTDIGIWPKGRLEKKWGGQMIWCRFETKFILTEVDDNLFFQPTTQVLGLHNGEFRLK